MRSLPAGQGGKDAANKEGCSFSDYRSVRQASGRETQPEDHHHSNDQGGEDKEEVNPNHRGALQSRR